MFEIIYRCKDCNEVVRTRGREDLTRDVTVYMPWPCRSCIAAGVSISTAVDLGSGEEFEEEEDSEEY